MMLTTFLIYNFSQLGLRRLNERSRCCDKVSSHRIQGELRKEVEVTGTDHPLLIPVQGLPGVSPFDVVPKPT
jgi:hypothetical protein